MAHQTWDDNLARAIIAQHAKVDGAALPILHALQNAFGHIDAAVVPVIAQALNLSKAEIHGVISFYHDFRSRAPKGRVVKLCRAEACQALGCDDLVGHLQRAHGLRFDDHGAAEGGHVTVESVYCLGHCALGPAALVDGAPVGRLTAERLDAMVAP